VLHGAQDEVEVGEAHPAQTAAPTAGELPADPPPTLGGVPLTLTTTAVVVSGYAPVPALALWAGSVCLATAPSTTALWAYVARATQVARSITGTPGRRARCQRCRWWTRRETLVVAALGITGYCPRCAAPAIATCQAHAGRLPGPDEFWCAGCQTIQPRTLLTPPDADGRRRWRCRPCRARQVRAAEHRR
jgi:hypothetical protein